MSLRILQFSAKAAQRGVHLDAGLKEFLDEVVIPALVKAYLSENATDNRLAITPNMPKNVPQSNSEDSPEEAL